MLACTCVAPCWWLAHGVSMSCPGLADVNPPAAECCALGDGPPCTLNMAGGCAALAGCAIVDTDGTPTILYTGVRLRSNPECGPLPPPECDLNLPFIESQLCAVACLGAPLPVLGGRPGCARPGAQASRAVICVEAALGACVLSLPTCAVSTRCSLCPGGCASKPAPVRRRQELRAMDQAGGAHDRAAAQQRGGA